MAKDKKSIAAILLGPPMKGASEEDGEHGSSDEELSVAADDVYDALQSKDRAAFASALSSYVKLCGMG